MSSDADERTRRMLEAPVGPALLRLAGPMVLGLAAIILFNVVDTLFVGRLGVRELAAMSFTFPVVFVVMNIAMGLGIGTTAVISRALGRGDQSEVRRLTTHGLILANAVVVVVAVAGLTTIEPLFAALGASPETIGLIADYMVPWYAGVGLLVIPMVGNSAIRATGDTKSPALVMVVAGVVNVILDPLLIYGLGPFPRLELQGAAIATVVSWAATFAAAIWLLGWRERMLEWAWPRLRTVLDSWRRILHVGLPAAATNLLVPVSGAVLTRMVADHGEDAVAAFGVGARLEGVAMVGIFALATALTPFVGQNHGAARPDRVRAAIRFSVLAALLWGVGAALLLALLAQPLARAFNDQPEVVAATVLYLLLVPFSYGGFGVAILVNSAYNALGRPLTSAALIVLRMFVLAIPVAWLGSRWFGLAGVLAGMAAANVLAGLAALLVTYRLPAGGSW